MLKFKSKINRRLEGERIDVPVGDGAHDIPFICTMNEITEQNAPSLDILFVHFLHFRDVVGAIPYQYTNFAPFNLKFVYPFSKFFAKLFFKKSDRFSSPLYQTKRNTFRKSVP